MNIHKGYTWQSKTLLTDDGQGSLSERKAFSIKKVTNNVLDCISSSIGDKYFFNIFHRLILQSKRKKNPASNSS